MNNNRLFLLLKGLEKTDFSRLIQFAESKFFNRNEKVIQFLQYLKKFYPDFQSEKLNKKTIHQYLFPDKAFNDDRLRQIMHKLTALTETFLVVTEAISERHNKANLLLKAYRKRNMYTFYKKKSHQAIKALREETEWDVDHYEQIHNIQHELLFHPDTSKFKSDTNILESCAEALDNYYRMRKLRYICEMYNQSNTTGTELNVWLIDEILAAEPDNSNEKATFLSNLYRSLIQLQRDKDQNDELKFKEVKNTFLNHIEGLPKIEKRYIYITLINYCTKWLNSGDQSYLIHTFELMEMALEQGLIFESNRITNPSFINVVVIASALKRFEQAQQFIESNQQFLKKDTRPDVINLSWAYWYYHQGDFETAAEHLRVIRTATLFGFQVKSLTLRMLFDSALQSGDWEMVQYNINSFRQAITTNRRVTEARKMAYTNFLKATRKLVRWINNPNRGIEELKQMRTQIDFRVNKNIAVRAWLFKTIDGLIKEEGS